VVRALVGKVGDGTWTGPVYFAVTVAGPTLECCDQGQELEGLLWRVTREPGPEADDEPRINASRSLRLFREEFRLDSATDFTYDWRPEAAATMLLRNYPALLRVIATKKAEEGALSDVRFALGEAVRMLEFQGNEEMRKALAKYWKELDPDNPEVDRWL
jgi:hypothetical protein